MLADPRGALLVADRDAAHAAVADEPAQPRDDVRLRGTPRRHADPDDVDGATQVVGQPIAIAEAPRHQQVAAADDDRVVVAHDVPDGSSEIRTRRRVEDHARDRPPHPDAVGTRRGTARPRNCPARRTRRGRPRSSAVRGRAPISGGQPTSAASGASRSTTPAGDAPGQSSRTGREVHRGMMPNPMAVLP